MRLNTAIKGWTHGRNIKELEVPEKLKLTIPTGLKFWDEAFGGVGMTPSVCCLFTGTPGAGKTTLMQQLADAITGSGNIALMNTAEESLFQLGRVAERLDLKHGYIAGQDNMVDEVLKHGDKLQSDHPDKQLFVIVDSLQALDDGFYPNGHTNSMTAVRALQKITDYCKSKYAIAIVIGQVNKSGEFQGKQQLKHIVDAHCHLHVDLDDRSPNFGDRIFEVQKNRFGSSGMAYSLKMSSRGLRANGSI